MNGRDRDRYRDGCHKELPFSKPVRKILVQGYKGADEADLQFKGKVCYNNDTFSAEHPKKPEAHEKPEMTAGGQRVLPLVVAKSLLLTLPLLCVFWW